MDSKNKIEKEQIHNLIERSLDRLYKEDMYLINNEPFNKEKNGSHHVGERSIVFRLAHYMQNFMDKDPLLKCYSLDCEYNRNGNHAKTLPAYPNGVYPDIVIHKRGSNSYNLLVAEIKTYWNSNTSEDKKKIKLFIDPNGEYKFDFGISLVIEKLRNEVDIKIRNKDDMEFKDE